MSKRKENKSREVLYSEYDSTLTIIPTVSYNEEPKIKIYDPRNGGYFFRRIGFTTNFSDETR